MAAIEGAKASLQVTVTSLETFTEDFEGDYLGSSFDVIIEQVSELVKSVSDSIVEKLALLAPDQDSTLGQEVRKISSFAKRRNYTFENR